jgi:hypothetical protein
VKVNVKCPPCPDCKKVGRVEVEESDFYKWQKGELIQVAFPYLDSDQREMLMTGYCGPCWTKLWEDVDEFGGEYA